MMPFVEEGEEVEEGLLSGVPKTPRFATPKLDWITRFLVGGTLLFVVFIVIPGPPNKHLLQEGPHDWAQYSPYTPQANYTHPPAGCQIDQVHILQRHGARYPTSGATERILVALRKLLSVKHKGWRLRFLNDYKYELGSDDLVAFGADQSFQAGVESFRRYSHLISLDNLPFVRASSSERVVLSATNWTAGFAAASKHIYQLPVPLILSEAGNDTLDDKMCPPAGSSNTQTFAWLSKYAPHITADLNLEAPGAGLADVDTFHLISLCPFESLAKQQKSPFCTLFENEWSEDPWGAFSGFNYSGDLDKYYGTGYGEPLGPVQGVGYVNELLARLTSTPVEDHTQTNSTLDSSHETFPLNRTLYADFSHDNAMIAIFSAMGLFKQPGIEPLDARRPHPARAWRVSSMVPFSGRMVVERLACDSEPMVRILVNDKAQPLEFCSADKNGLCTLDAFVRSQAYARNGSDEDWAKCRA